MPRLKTPTELLGTCQAASYLGVTRSTLTSWRRRGEITPTAVVSGPRCHLYKFAVGDLDKLKERIDYDA